MKSFKTDYFNRTLVFICVAILSACNTNPKKQHIFPTLSGEAPLIIAHRGASGYLPEHTLAAYEKAIDMGADYIEPDLVMTKDSVLIVRHEPMLSGTTNVSELPKFNFKKNTKNIDGKQVEDWFVSDFTFSEIKELKAKQAFPDRNQEFNNRYPISSFDEVIVLVKRKSNEIGRKIGIYPETKHPSFHKSYDLPLTDVLLTTLEREGWNHEKSSVYIQSFEVSNLQYIRSKSSVKTVQLISCYDVDIHGNLVFETPEGAFISDGKPYDWYLEGKTKTYQYFTTTDGLDFLKTYATGIGVWKPFVLPFRAEDKDKDGMADDLNGDEKIDNRDKIALPPTSLIKNAHDKKLEVHAYTFRNESKRLLKSYKNDPKLEYKHFYSLGLDAIFTDFTDTAVQSLRP
ncbi:MAG: glycerophosphodiester phosphodiesterase [Flavicella sp.]